jgi:sterol-4alpha-carboxylate 3-dehydrogenase (decarboxylating)
MGKYVWKNLGYPQPVFKIPAWLIIFIAIILDIIVAILKPLIAVKFSITYFRAVLATKNRTFSIAKAKRVLQYEPKISMEEGLNRTLLSFMHEKKKVGAKKDN